MNTEYEKDNEFDTEYNKRQTDLNYAEAQCDDNRVMCSSCCGTGKVLVENDDPDDTTNNYEECKDCNGTGYSN